MHKKLLSLLLFWSLFLLTGCNNTSSIITHTRPADWTVERAMSYFNHFRPSLSYNKKAVEESLQIGFPYYKINNMIYYGDDISKTYIENSDVDSFFPLIGDYALDNWALYIAWQRYPVDTGSLIIYGYSSYIASSGTVYFLIGEDGMKPLTWVDPEKFSPISYPRSEEVMLSSMYAKDDKFIYARGQILSGADYDTFEIIDAWTAKDKNHTYKNGKIIQ